MVIRLEAIEGYIARVYDKANPGPMDDFDTTFYVEWDKAEPACLWIKGMNGRMNQTRWREFLALCIEMGVTTIKAKRAGNHGIVFGVKDANGDIRVDVSRLNQRFNKRSC